MYGEEADMCLRAAELGYRPMITTDAEIMHLGCASAKLAIVGGGPQQHDQVAATSFARNQAWNRHQQRDLSEEHKLREMSRLGCRKESGSCAENGSAVTTA
jgi:hypothetical protein